MPAFSPFNARSHALSICKDHQLDGKTVVITGANTGIGFETARAMAATGAHIILAGRNEERHREALSRIHGEFPDTKVEYAELDLASLQSIRDFCDQLEAQSIDILIANAGLISTKYQETRDGFELTVGVCHIGHSYLIKLLMPRLLAAGTPRVVMLSSSAHAMPATLDFDHFPYPAKGYAAMRAYGQAKLCNLLYAKELQRRYGEQGLTACAVHPGNMVTTDFGRDSLLVSLGMKLVSPFTKSASQGAATTVLCALHEPAAEVAGGYFLDCRPSRGSAEANNADAAARVWEITEQWLSEAVPG